MSKAIVQNSASTQDAISEPYIVNLDEMIGISEGSIVSRIIANKQAGAVTMFAFDEGQAISEQTLPFDSVLFVTSGTMEIEINRQEAIEVSTEEMVFIPADTPYEMYAPMPFKMFSVLIRAKAPKVDL